MHERCIVCLFSSFAAAAYHPCSVRSVLVAYFLPESSCAYKQVQHASAPVALLFDWGMNAQRARLSQGSRVTLHPLPLAAAGNTAPCAVHW